MITRNQQSHRLALCAALCALIAGGLLLSSFEPVSRHRDSDAVTTQPDAGPDNSLLTLISAAPNPRPTPVILSGRSRKAGTGQQIDIHLAIGDGYELFSANEYQVFRPLKTEVLDAQMRPIRSKIQYPPSTAAPTHKSLGGVYFVYRGDVEIVATSTVPSHAAFVRVHFNGSYRGHT